VLRQYREAEREEARNAQLCDALPCLACYFSWAHVDFPSTFGEGVVMRVALNSNAQNTPRPVCVYYWSRSGVTPVIAEHDPYSYLFKLKSLAIHYHMLCYITFSTPAPSLLLSPVEGCAPVLRAVSPSPLLPVLWLPNYN